MFLGDERERKLLGWVSRQFEKIGQHQADFIDHDRPTIGFHHKAVNVVAGGDPNARFAIPPRFYRDRSAHDKKIVPIRGDVNP